MPSLYMYDYFIIYKKLIQKLFFISIIRVEVHPTSQQSLTGLHCIYEKLLQGILLSPDPVILFRHINFCY